MRFNGAGIWGGETMSMHQNEASKQNHVVFHVGECQGFLRFWYYLYIFTLCYNYYHKIVTFIWKNIYSQLIFYIIWE